jgi:hypothetical protein
MTEVAVSPHFSVTDLSGADLPQKIDIFADQMRGWLLDHADVLASAANPHSQHAGFAILTILSVYAESIACFIKGATSDKHSQEFFTFGLGQIFPGFDDSTLKALQKDFYRQVRCGQLHQGLVRGKVSIVRGGTAAIVVNRDSVGNPVAIQIDPWVFLMHAKQHFDLYLATLRDPNRTLERRNFEAWFDTRAA